jgi:predicted aspartyl protease
MTGSVDGFGRALVPIRLKVPATGKLRKIQAWIDTGFTGELVLPKAIIRSLGLARANVVKAELGDGSEAIFKYVCLHTQVVRRFERA